MLDQVYLFILCIRDVLLHAEGPVDVERVLVQGEHEDDEDEEGVEHREEEDHLVAQLFEAGGDGVLLRLVGVQRVEVLLDQVGPEGDLGAGEIVHLAAGEHRPVLWMELDELQNVTRQTTHKTKITFCS